MIVCLDVDQSLSWLKVKRMVLAYAPTTSNFFQHIPTMSSKIDQVILVHNTWPPLSKSRWLLTLVWEVGSSCESWSHPRLLSMVHLSYFIYCIASLCQLYLLLGKLNEETYHLGFEVIQSNFYKIIVEQLPKASWLIWVMVLKSHFRPIINHHVLVLYWH